MVRFSSIIGMIWLLVSCGYTDKEPIPHSVEDQMLRPSDHLYFQRAYPETTADLAQMSDDISRWYKRERQQRHMVSAGQWVTEGPANIGARINVVALDPQDQQTMYIGYSAGGAYRTRDGGTTWDPIFDDFPFLAIGALTVNPHRPSEVLLGTGDPNITGTPFIGNGIYRSADRGRSWEHLGLPNVGIVSEILYDPTDPNIIYAATMGVPYFRDPHRGVYKSTDRGATWTKILYLGDGTGVIDLVMDPSNPQVLYAAGWDRVRNYEESTTYGEGARIYRTSDGGAGWSLLQGGLPMGIQSRIGLSICAANPNRLYAVYVNVQHEVGGIYTTTDGGDLWTEIRTDGNSGLPANSLLEFGWYFGKVRVHPTDENDLFMLGVRLWRWNFRTRTWSQAASDLIHPDMHDLVFSPNGDMILATDGGLYRSSDDADSWQDIEDIATTQFYHVAYNPHRPDLFYGGAQDNGSVRGSHIDVTGWEPYFSGDGFRTIFHPEDPKIYYVETQLGDFFVTDNGGQSHRRVRQGIDLSDKINWDAPVIMSHHSPDVLYYGTDRVYRSTGGVDVRFQPISDDLTDEVVLLAATSNITALEESHFDPNIVFAGTGDGNLWRTMNVGTTWRKIDSDLPDRYFTSIHGSPDFERTIYVTQSGYRAGETIPHVHKSEDLGSTWIDISGDLPPFPVNDLLVLPRNDDQVLFAATDAGVYFTENSGGHWRRLGDNMPAVPIFDLVYHAADNLLVAGSFAKSILSYDLWQEGISTDGTSSFEHVKAGALSLFPNPADHQIVIQNFRDFADPSAFRMYDQRGLVLRDLRGGGETIELGGLSPGVYHIALKQGGIWYTGRFVKQ